MDAVEYVKQRRRMCDSYETCTKCPASEYPGCATVDGIPDIVSIVEQWAKEHPVKTRQSEFLKQWPDAEISGDGLPSVAPCQLCVGLLHERSRERCESRQVCDKCRRDFWLKEI